MAAETPKPNPALKRLERLVGTWIIEGRTLGSKDNNASGRVSIDWLPGGFFLQQRGEIEVRGSKVYGLEIVGYDPATDIFPSYVFSNVGEASGRYYWNVQGDVVTYWTEGRNILADSVGTEMFYQAVGDRAREWRALREIRIMRQ